MVFTFMFFDIASTVAVGITAIFPSKSCPLDKIPPIDRMGACNLSGADYILDNFGCRSFAFFDICYEIMAMVCAVLKFFVIIVAARIVFRRYRRPVRSPGPGCPTPPSSLSVRTNLHESVSRPAMYFLRLVPSAILLPPFGILLVHHSTTGQVDISTDLFQRGCGDYTMPSSWWVMSVLFVIMSLLFVIEVIIFVAAPDRYLRRENK